jgi:CubicO group peptidase (beta-lactamase class C family)
MQAQTSNMRNLTSILRLLEPVVTEIANLSGIPGISVGILHQSQVVYQANFGYRDFEAKLPATSDTIYAVASLTKAFTASTVASIVQDGLLEWSIPIRRYYPEFQSQHPEVQDLTSILDLLSMQTGLSGNDALWFHVPPLINDSQILETFSHLPRAKPFRSTMQYNNLGYAITSAIVERQTGKSLSSNMKERILDPLGMTRTGFQISQSSLNNVAKTYTVMTDGTPFHLTRPLIKESSWLLAAGGLRSSVNDLLMFYKTLLESYSSQLKDGTTSNSNSPLKQVTTVLSGHTFLGNQKSSLRERSYSIGWVRTQLPGVLGAIGYNEYFVKNMPVAGSGSPPRLAIYNQGNLPGGTAAVYMFPETNSTVVVLANAFGLTDAPDWIAQLLVETLFEDSTNADYVALAREAVQSSARECSRIEKELSSLQDSSPRLENYDSFTGRYFNAIETFFLLVSVINGELSVSFQGSEQETYSLKHSHGNVFSWYPGADELSRRGRHPSWFRASYYLLQFDPKSSSLVWEHDSIFTSGNSFTRQKTSWGEYQEYGRTKTVLTLGVLVIILCYVQRRRLIRHRPRVRNLSLVPKIAVGLLERFLNRKSRPD